MTKISDFASFVSKFCDYLQVTAIFISAGFITLCTSFICSVSSIKKEGTRSLRFFSNIVCVAMAVGNNYSDYPVYHIVIFSGLPNGKSTGLIFWSPDWWRALRCSSSIMAHNKFVRIGYTVRVLSISSKPTNTGTSPLSLKFVIWDAIKKSQLSCDCTV